MQYKIDKYIDNLECIVSDNAIESCSPSERYEFIGIAWALKHPAYPILLTYTDPNDSFYCFTSKVRDLGVFNNVYDNLATDTSKYTAAMLWVMEFQLDPPEWMRHPPSLINKYGWTCAMLWTDFNEEPNRDAPEWMRSNPPSQTTCAHIWITRQNSDPPEWMRCNPSETDLDGLTCAMRWVINVRTPPPNWMIHDASLRSIRGLTVGDYWDKHVRSTLKPVWMNIDFNEVEALKEEIATLRGKLASIEAIIKQ